MSIKSLERAAFWQRHLENFQASGLTRTAYCRKHNLKLHQLSYQLDRVSKTSADKAAFARVALVPSVAVARTSPARLCFGSDLVLEFDAGSDPAWIAQVITALGDQR